MSTPFEEAKVNKNDPPTCVDGRRSTVSRRKSSPKMLGGSLHIVLLWCLWERTAFDQHSFHTVFGKLKQHGFGLGVHRGSHKDPDADISDCGFADNLPAIIEMAAVKKEDINEAVMGLFHTHGSKLKAVKSFHEDLKRVWKKIEDYPRGGIRIWGEDAVMAAHLAGATVDEVEGEHHEEEAFINLDKGTTLDTTAENKEGHQAFDMDLWMILEHAHALHLPKEFSLLASLILYVATEIILVERKGKKALPIEIEG